MNISFKKIEDVDLNCINDFMYFSKKYWGYTEDFMTKFMNLFQFTDEQLKSMDVYFMCLKEDMIGMYGFKVEDEKLYLDMLFLHPNYIGQGLGNKLWEQVIVTANNYPQEEFEFDADPNAEGFYLKKGCLKVRVKESPIEKNRLIPILKYKK